VLLRLAHLAPEAVRLARAVAILGPRSDLRRAAALAEVERAEATQLVVACVAANILEDEATLDFVHPMLRTAVLGDLAATERSRWHERAAELLAAEDAPSDEVAPHLLATSPAGSEWVVAVLRDAAARAMEGAAPEVAASYLRRALGETPPQQTRVELLVELAGAQVANRPDSAREHYAEALDLADAPEQRAAIALELGRTLALSMRFMEAADVMEAAKGELGERDPKLYGALVAEIVQACRWDLTARPRIHLLMEETQRRFERGEPLNAQLYTQLAIEAGGEARSREVSVDYGRRALEGFELMERDSGLNVSLAIFMILNADLVDEARDHAERWLRVVQRQGRPIVASLAATACALVALQSGYVSDAHAYLQESLDLLPGWAPPPNIAWLVAVRVLRGELDEASADLASRGLDGELPPLWPLTVVLFYRAQLKAARGDHNGAAADYLASGDLVERWGVRNPAWIWWRSGAANSLAAAGEREEALRLATEELELAREWGTDRSIGIALRAIGNAQGGAPGIATLREGVACLERSKAPLELVRAQLDLGSALRRAGERSESREHLRRALDTAHRYGAGGLAQLARDELVVAGGRPRRDALRGRDALTPSELRVARMAASGRTNRQIAQALFVTLRTVELHLTNAYGKLGIKSRKELPDALDAWSQS
jgi:ATP/maltotriose-dependent transcriptional regulator MalT